MPRDSFPVIASLDLELTPRRKLLLAAFAAATILLIPAGLWIAGIPAFVLCAWLVATDPEPKLRRRLAILLGCVLILAACDINPGLSNENFLKVGIPLTLVIVLPSLIQHFGVRGIIRYRFWPVHWRKHDVIYTILSIPLAFAGALLSALTFYGAGRLLGAAFVHRIAPQRVQRAVQGAGLEAMFAVRIVPLLPFTFVNLCAGAFHVRLRTYVLGTLLGMAPGIIAMCLLGDQLMVLVRNPTPKAIAVAAFALLLVGGLLYALQRRTKVAPREAEPTQTPQ